MAEIMIACAVNKVADMLFDLAESQTDSVNLLKELKDDLESIQELLVELNKVDFGEKDIESIVKEIRQLAYQAEDAIDDLAIKFVERRSWSSSTFFYGIRRYVSRFAYPLSVRPDNPRSLEVIRRKVKDLKAELNNLLVSKLILKQDDGNEYFDYVVHGKAEVDNGLSGIGMGKTIDEDDGIVGLDADVKRIREELLNPSAVGKHDGIAVIAIVGMGGIGKTTLARMVYDHIGYGEFDCRVWVYVGGTSCLGKHVLLDILQQSYGGSRVLLSSSIDSCCSSEEEFNSLLANTIAKSLKWKKYLLVLDDVWNTNGLENILTALPLNSKMILTTRVDSLPQMIPECKYVHKMNLLPFVHAWSLFCRKAFSFLPPPSAEDAINCTYSNLKPIAEGIVTACGGLPLAIVVIGGLLSTVETKPKQWRRIMIQFKSHIGPETPDSMHHVVAALCTAYHNLPLLLKQCLLYFALFPENCELSVKRLDRFWSAEGFVQKTSTKGEATTGDMSIGASALDQLICRNLVLIARVGADGEVETCKVLQPIWNFIQITASENNISAFLPKRGMVPPLLHRLSMSVTAVPYYSFSKWGKVGRIQSLLLSPDVESQQKQRVPSSINFKDMKLLRVLDLPNAPLEVLPNDLAGLVRLRYLGLRGTDIKSLPLSIVQLSSLETLDLRATKLMDLPCLFELIHLRHLMLASSYIDKVIPLPDGFEISSLANLQTLTGVKITSKVAHALGNLSHLQKLSGGQLRKEDSKSFCASLNQLTSLRSLVVKSHTREQFSLEKLENLSISKLRLGGPVGMFNRVACLSSLTYLYLWDCVLDEDPLQMLENLPNLVHLSMCNAFTGQSMRCSSGGFRKLKKLSIVHFKRLETWERIEGGAMRSLKELFIAHCRNLHNLPEGLADLDSLEVIRVVDVPLELDAKQRLKVIEVPQSLTLTP